MNLSKNKKYLFLIFGLILILLIPLESLITQKTNLQAVFNKKLNVKEQVVAAHLDDLIHSTNIDSLFTQIIHDETLDGLSFYVFENSQLKLWSNSTISFESNNEFKKNQGVLFLKDGFYHYQKREKGTRLFLGLILIKNEYSIQNTYLKSSLHPSFGISDDVQISLKESGKKPSVYDAQGNFLFSMKINGSNYQSSDWISIASYFLGFILLILFVYQRLKQHKKYKKHASLISIGTVFIFYLFSTVFSIPENIYYQKIFSPTIFGHSAVLPSLGHFLIVALTILVLTILWVKRIKTNSQQLLLKAIVSMVVVAVLNVVFTNWFAGLIINSNINFDVNNLLDLSAYSFIGILIVIVLYTCLAVLIKSIVNDYYSASLKQNQLLTLFWVFVLGAILIAHLVFEVNWKIASWMLVAILIFAIGNSTKTKFYQSILLVILIAGTITVGFVQFSKQKEQVNQEFLIKKLAKEADPVTEYLFADLKNKIEKDTLLANHSSSYWDEKDELDAFLLEKYFTGYWNKYDVFLFLCLPEDTLVVQPENKEVSCTEFFTEKAERESVSRNHFNDNIQFLYNEEGIGSYLGNIAIKPTDTTLSNATLYIEMLPKILSNNEGYPELLLNEKEIGVSTSLNKYSFAKYKKNKLVNQNGDCNYNLELEKNFHFNENGFYTQSSNNYQNLYYQSDKNTVMVLSAVQKTNFNYITTFSYFFICCSLFILIVGLLFNIEPFHWRIAFTDFSTKIQLFIIVSTFLSFVLFGLGTSYYIEKQYDDKNTHNLQEKVQSVIAELNNELAEKNTLDDINPDFVTNQLVKYSNIFYADINLYGTNGQLIATSRPEIIERGLISKRMNPYAFHHLKQHKKSSFIHEENIGKMNYLSAYVPFRNNENKVIAYLNLPYFAKQNQLENELSQFFTALINIYALLFLVSIFIAISFANYISEPVRLIKDKIRALQLGKSNEFIDWKSNDEIGSLVKEYNQKVLELEKSAKLLAQSERESAWREMAKQVAHEIKNPLTPMKLSIQHLERSIDDNPTDLPERIKRTAKTLVEQIDTLTNIANEFSSFAKMPTANEQQLNLIEILETTIDLYKKEQVEIVFENLCEKEAVLFADKDQLNRLFSNLIKNAIQAIPENQKDKIEVVAGCKKNNYIITITDNGGGIPKELQEKIFTPNFTTKTTGMGLGLAMVKNIVENLNGTIDFTTSNKGTTFKIEIPC
ncbi:MAG: GHKL domain-containing protein [Bacteroidetes bacterium]|nr:GHKL domain-containing protein [Bacteroidota bacterium]